MIVEQFALLIFADIDIPVDLSPQADQSEVRPALLYRPDDGPWLRASRWWLQKQADRMSVSDRTSSLPAWRRFHAAKFSDRRAARLEVTARRATD